ncbi:MAG TPA: S26 family signal peptidase, partial [Candidatus Binatus sp.]|nr:S26 family signal peptidase [Candidatus Binatus sp.]
MNDDFTTTGPISPDAGTNSSAGSPLATPSAPSSSAVPSNTFRQRLVRELLSWVWVALAFFLITGSMVQARVIPSASMEGTLLIGDHLLMSRFGYDIGLPFTRYHI